VLDFSIITPVYNGEKYIEETIESVLNCLRGQEFEYLVIDDGSTDNTSRILQKFASKVTVITQDNCGQASAINLGIELAKGRYALIVNADDPLSNPKLFSEAKKIMNLDSTIVATYPNWELIDENGKTLETIDVKEFSLDELVGRFNCLIGPGGVFRTNQAKELNGWDVNFKYVPDYDFWLRLSQYGKFQHIPEVLAAWRSHTNSISIGSRGLEMSRERIRVIEDYLARNPNTPKSLNRMSRANACYRSALLSYFDNRVSGRRLVLKAIRIYPRILFEKDIRATVFLLTSPLSNILFHLVGKYFKLNNIEDSIRKSVKK
jgi:glycosyltransferase involved in cell wall biosynthesis